MLICDGRQFLDKTLLNYFVDFRPQESFEARGVRLQLAWKVSFLYQYHPAERYLIKQYFLHRLYAWRYDVGEAHPAVSAACWQTDCNSCAYMVFDCAPDTYDNFLPSITHY